MKKRLRALLFLILFWLIFFVFARLFFILFHHRDSFDYGIAGLAGTFLHGLKLDISTTTYYIILPVFAAIFWIWFNGNWYSRGLKIYSWILICFSTAIVITDANLYSYWGFRMDYTPLFYLKTPGEAMASVSAIHLILFFIAVIAISGFFIFLFNRYVAGAFVIYDTVKHKAAWTFAMLLLFASLIIPLRGGTGVAPINAGSVYFSSRMFLNHAAVNAVWNVGTTAFSQKPVSNPYNFETTEQADSTFGSLRSVPGSPQIVLNNKRPNILLIMLESFSGYMVGPLGGDSLATPRLNRIIKDGILFTNFYASGNRTDKAMPAIINGYPAQPAQSIIKEPRKSQSLPGLVKIFNDLGYRSSFWYGGEIDFANFNSYVLATGFRTIVTMDDFDPSNYNSKWGVHDHVMYEALKDSMKTIQEPFFNVVLTLSSHEPFDVPVEAVFQGNDQLTKYRNSVHYADEALGNFIDWASATDWWKNTLVILVADHCCRISTEVPVYSQEIFRIPMVWTGGALSERGLEVTKLGSQTDIAVTLLNQLDLKGDFPFSKDLFVNNNHSYAFYTYNEGFAFLTDTSAVIYDHKLKGPVLSEGKNPEVTESLGKAYLQVLFNDYLKR